MKESGTCGQQHKSRSEHINHCVKVNNSVHYTAVQALIIKPEDITLVSDAYRLPTLALYSHDVADGMNSAAED